MQINNENLKKNDCDIWTPDGSGQVLHDDPGYDDHVMRADWMESGYPALHCGAIPDPEIFSRQDTESDFNINAYPLKQAGSNDYKIPRYLAPLRSFIEASANDQHRRNKLADMKHAVLFYRRWHVFYDQGQVSTQWHIDDALGPIMLNGLSTHAFYPAPDMPVHIYATSDLAGTQVQTNPVPNAKLVFSGHTGYAVAGVQAENTRITAPYEIVLMNGYTHHRAVSLSEVFSRAAAQNYPSLQPLLEPTRALRSFAAVMYIPTDPMRDLLGQHQKVRSGTALVW